MINELIVNIFARIGHTWKVGGRYIDPTEQDVEKLLDEAAVKLYDGAVGDRLEAAGLIIEKANKGHDVYVYVGNYE